MSSRRRCPCCCSDLLRLVKNITTCCTHPFLFSYVYSIHPDDLIAAGSRDLGRIMQEIALMKSCLLLACPVRLNNESRPALSSSTSSSSSPPPSSSPMVNEIIASIKSTVKTRWRRWRCRSGSQWGTSSWALPIPMRCTLLI